jgi:hypothetical protein
MRKILDEIRGGSFAKEWILENKANRPQFNALARRDQDHLIEQVGAELRAMMSWVQRPQGVQAAAEAQSAEQQTVGTGGGRSNSDGGGGRRRERDRQRRGRPPRPPAGPAPPRRDRKAGRRRRLAPPRLPQPTPEQTCLGCTIAFAVVLVSVLFWAWFFWRQGQAEERTLREQQLQTPAGRQQRARQQDRPGAR